MTTSCGKEKKLVRGSFYLHELTAIMQETGRNQFRKFLCQGNRNGEKALLPGRLVFSKEIADRSFIQLDP